MKTIVLDCAPAPECALRQQGKLPDSEKLSVDVNERFPRCAAQPIPDEV